jgi:uncharacterized membrane protein YebE (DUF533 family)
VRRLTISPQACSETLAVLIAFAWADGKVDDKERASVRGAAQVLNLSQEQRAQLDTLLTKPATLDGVHADRLSTRDRDFAYVAAAWMCGVDDEVAGKEEGLLWKLADLFALDDDRKSELERIAQDLGSAKGGPRQWADEVVRLFKSIPPRLDPAGPGGGDDEIEVSFE